MLKRIRNLFVAKSPKTYLFAAAGCLLLAVGLLFFYLFTPFSASDSVQYVCVDSDDTQDSVLAKLRPIGRNRSIVGMATMMRHGDYGSHIRTGRYAIAPGETTFAVFRRLRGGTQTPLNLTVPEARTMESLAAQLSRKLMLDSATIATALRDSAFCARWDYDTATVAALFVPNTYEVYWDISLEQFMERMAKEHDAFWRGERSAKAAAMNMTPAEVATLASIVDEETASTAEKPMVAGMYVNRLRIGMPLQADPTVKFALHDFALRRIRHKHLSVDSPYNTYANPGLPPGPIKIASVAGIDAVLNHTEHDYLYMCAKDDFSGTHTFARTYREHLDNAARYAKALNSRGIK